MQIFDKIPTDNSTFLTKLIMSAEKFNFAPKFLKNEIFRPKFSILNKNFPSRKTFFDNFPTTQNLRKGEQLPGLDASVCTSNEHGSPAS